jgi:protein-tyrosine phosphatase
MATADLITPGLYLGSRHVVKNTAFLNMAEIKVLISILTDNEFHDYFQSGVQPPIEEWHQVRCDDSSEEEIYKHFLPMHDVIQTALDEGKNVLVHCAGGISRSPTIVIAHLMIERKITFTEALQHVKQYRDCVRPNEGFKSQLATLEKFVLRGM